MRRRDFIKAVAASTAGLPLAAHAQQRGRTPLIGVAAGFGEEEMRPLLAALRDELRKLGWVVGRNVAMEARYGDGQYADAIVRALIELQPNVIVTQGTGILAVVRRVTKTVPVVFTMVPDPVKLGLIENLARPGGNITGFTNFEFSFGGKWLELLKELRPSVKRVLQISNPNNPNNVQFSAFIEGLGRSISLDVTTAQVRNGDEIAAAITAAGQQPDGSVLVLPDSLLVVNRALIIEHTAKHRLPAIYPFRIFATDGGLISYGLNFSGLYRQAANYVDRILRGEKPGELPVQAPNTFELLINLKTAKALDIEVPPLLLVRADEVIE